jgi:hypothetical protein
VNHVPREWDDERLDSLIREAVQKRLEPAGAFQREVHWQRLREQLDTGWRGKQVKIGPWAVSRLGLAACCLLLMIVLVPLAFSDLAGISQRWSASVAVKEDAGPPAPEMPVDTLKQPVEVGGNVLEKRGSAVDADGVSTATFGLEKEQEAVGEAGMPSATVTVTDTTTGVLEGLTIDEAREKIPFTVWFPRELPPGFNLVDITYEPHSPDTGKVILYFDHPDGRYLRIEQERLSGPAGEREPPFYEESPQLVTVRNRAAQMLVHDDDWCELHWNENGTVFKMWGQIHPREMKKMAKSLFDISASGKTHLETLRN